MLKPKPIRTKPFFVNITYTKDGFRIAEFKRNYDPRDPEVPVVHVAADAVSAGDIVATILTKLVSQGD